MNKENSIRWNAVLTSARTHTLTRSLSHTKYTSQYYKPTNPHTLSLSKKYSQERKEEAKIDTLYPSRFSLFSLDFCLSPPLHLSLSRSTRTEIPKEDDSGRKKESDTTAL